MNNESQAIEVEVVEVDGVTKPPQVERSEEKRPLENLRELQGRALSLNSHWWPLWVLLGIIVVILALTVGVVFAIIFVIFRSLRGIKRALIG